MLGSVHEKFEHLIKPKFSDFKSLLQTGTSCREIIIQTLYSLLNLSLFTAVANWCEMTHFFFQSKSSEVQEDEKFENWKKQLEILQVKHVYRLVVWLQCNGKHRCDAICYHGCRKVDKWDRGAASVGRWKRINQVFVFRKWTRILTFCATSVATILSVTRFVTLCNVLWNLSSLFREKLYELFVNPPCNTALNYIIPCLGHVNWLFLFRQFRTNCFPEQLQL